jgi:pilus assembly protein CpaB
MKKAQLIGIAVAGGAGILAFVLMGSVLKAPPKPAPVVERPVDAIKVLVARSDLPLGTVATEQSFRWQDWPKDAISPSFLTSAAKPNALTEYSGYIARAPILSGEPITENKVIKAGSGGILAAILPPGMRAISTKIDEKTAVAKLILPNDHVDVILTQRKRSKGGNEDAVSDTLFRNVRILAIGQQIEAKEGKKNAEGNVATLELTPKQSELLALANTMGEISLSLRSVADLNGEGPSANDDMNKKDRGSAVRILRYGVKSRAYGVN